MLATAIQFVLVFFYATVALWTAVNSALEHPGHKFGLRETGIIGFVSLLWIIFYCAALLAIAVHAAPTLRPAAQRRRRF